MKRTQWIALAVLALLALGVGYLVRRNRQPPLVPADEVHAPGPAAQPCLDCHGPEGVAPRSPNHPLGQDCMRCHGVAGR